MAKRLKMPKNKVVTTPARLWKRIGAFIVDLIIIDFIISPVSKMVEEMMPSTDISRLRAYLESSAGLSNTFFFIAIFIGIVAILYFTILEYKFGQSIGKMLFKIRVESVTEKLSFLQCMIRTLFMIPVIPFVFFIIIDPIYFLISKTDQRLLEKWSRTKTVESDEINAGESI